MARKRAQRQASGYTILVVDDQEASLVSMRAVLELEGHRVLLADGAQAALDLFTRNKVHLLLVDYFMPRVSGEELIAEIRKIDTQVQIVLQTGYSGEKPPREMLRKLDIQGYHDKAEGPEKLLLWVDVALKAYEQLRRAREAEILKAQIVTNVSHEFRTPIHIILGYADILCEDELVDPAGHDRLKAIRRNARVLLDLVDGFLRLSDADANLAGTEPAHVDGPTLQAEFARWAEHFIGGKPIEFLWEVAGDLPAVLADHSRLRVVAMNLIANAVKFTPQGAIAIGAETTADAVRIDVRDTGVGIAAEHHESIFEPFIQLDAHGTRHREGTGIGLAIARKLARQMQGDITVCSEPGQGATFSLSLPRAHPETLAHGPGAAGAFRPAATGAQEAPTGAHEPFVSSAETPSLLGRASG